MSLKVVRYQGDIHQGFDLYPIYPGQHLHVDVDWVRIEGGQYGVISIATDPGTNFYIMNGDGDTIERFPWDWLKGSPERSQRVMKAASRQDAPDS